MPAEDAAVVLGVGSTMLKRISRKFGIRMWPYRKMQINLRREKGPALNQSLYNYNANVPHATLPSIPPAPVPTEYRTTGREDLTIARALSDKIREITAAQKASTSIPQIPVIQSKPVDPKVATPQVQGQPAQQEQVPVNTAPAGVAEALIRAALTKARQPSPSSQKEGSSAQPQAPPPPPPAPSGVVSQPRTRPPPPRPVSPPSQAVASPITVPALGNPPATTNTLSNKDEVGLLNELIGKLHAALVERVEHVSLPGGGGGGGGASMPTSMPTSMPPRVYQRRIQPGNALDVLATVSVSAYQDFSNAASMPPPPPPPPPPPQSRPEKTVVEIALLHALATQHMNDPDYVRSTLSKAMLQMLPPPGIERNHCAINHHTGRFSMQQQQQQQQIGGGYGPQPIFDGAQGSLEMQQQQQQGFSAWQEPRGRDGKN